MFRDRQDAALQLARALSRYKDDPRALILAVPRGGLPLGAVLARELGLPLDVLLVKKIGHPDNPEMAVGAVGLESEDVADGAAGVSREYLAAETLRIRAELRRRYRAYRAAAAPATVKGKTVILVDDGAATGRTLFAAIGVLRRAGAGRIVVAAPVAPREAVVALERAADEAICLETPADFFAIGQFYRNFDAVSDEEAVELLRRGSPREKL